MSPVRGGEYRSTLAAPTGAWYKSAVSWQQTGASGTGTTQRGQWGMAKAAAKSAKERAEILAQVFEGMTNGRTVADTARALKINPGTIRRWIALDPEVTAEYQRLRPLLGAALAVEAIRVARESTTQTTAMDRVLIETLKWAASKSAPAEYGEKQTVQHEGQQTLQVKVIEDEAPVRNVKALREAAVTAVLEAAATQPLRLPKPEADEIS